MSKEPCIVCGSTDYSLSMGGPPTCPACDGGVDPGLTECRLQLQQAEAERDRLREKLAEVVAVLMALLDSIDYRNGACKLNEPIAGCLPSELLEQAEAALAKAKEG